nr:hypothetical protein [Hyphomonas sp. Mor2]
MTVKTLFTKRVRRYIGAALATAVTTFVGLQALMPAEAQSCTLHDATRWQLAITNSEVEQTPTYIRFVTETFLRNCPDRPEFAGASRVAGIAAADTGDARAAVLHFRNAGPMRDVMSNLYAIAAHLAVNEDLAAWRLRDEMIDRWRTRLERHPMVSVSEVELEQGTIYQLHFADVSEGDGPRSAWVGVPKGPGWPATISLSNSPFQLAMQRISDGEESGARHIELNRCYDRRVLARLDERLSSTDLDGAAQAGLTAYLAAPDVRVEASDRAISPCVLHGRLLPLPKAR